VFLSWSKPDAADAVTVLIDTGLRGSELWRLEKRDIDFKKDLLSVWMSKNKKARSVPLTGRVKAILEPRLKVHPIHPFPYRNAWLDRLFVSTRKHLGLEKDKQFIPYALRHTCASRLVQRGVNLRVLRASIAFKLVGSREGIGAYSKTVMKGVQPSMFVLLTWFASQLFRPC